MRSKIAVPPGDCTFHVRESNGEWSQSVKISELQLLSLDRTKDSCQVTVNDKKYTMTDCDTLAKEYHRVLGQILAVRDQCKPPKEYSVKIRWFTPPF